MLIKVLNDLPRVFALSVGVHDDNAALTNESLESIINLRGGQGGIWIAGDDIPENELQTEGMDDLDSLVVEFAVGGTEQRGVMAVLGFEKSDGSQNFLLLLIDWMHRQVGMDLAVGADFKERNLEKRSYLMIVFCDPFTGQEEGGRDFVVDQIINEGLIVSRAALNWAEIESERHARAGRRTRLDHLT